MPFFFVNCPITPKYSAIVDGVTSEVPVSKKLFDKKKWEKSGK
jgi:hypothetical protein